MRIEFGDLKIGEVARRNLMHAVETNWVTGGPKVKAFEEGWGKLFGYKQSVAMSSGTDADIASCAVLYDLGAQRGDEVIVPALSFIATSNAVLAAGLTPKFVDVDRKTLNINPEKIEEKISDKTKAIMVVHTMGKPCTMDRIMEIAKKNDLMVIEDSCEAHGAKFKGKGVGHWGDMATFSFYAAHLICCGEGGMVSTNNEEVGRILRSVRNHGRKSLYFDHVRFGLNSKMNDMEASLGLEGVELFWEVFNKRKENFHYMTEKLRDLRSFAWFNLEEEDEVVSPHAFSVTLKDPKFNYKRLYSFLEENSIMCKRNFGSNPTQHKAFAFLGHKLGEFPEAEYIGDNGLHFGIHQHLTQEDLDYVSEVLHKYFESELWREENG